MNGSRNLLIFPNLIIIDLVMGMVVRTFEPLAPDYQHVTAWQLAIRDEDPELRRLRLDNFLTFWGPGGLATPDDVEALECCQRGFAGQPGAGLVGHLARDAEGAPELHRRDPDADVLAPLERADDRRADGLRAPGR